MMITPDPKFSGTVYGVAAAVVKPRPLGPAIGAAGIGMTLMAEESGELRVGITTRHIDGTLLTAMLGEQAFNRLAEQFAEVILALTAGTAEPAFGSHQ